MNSAIGIAAAGGVLWRRDADGLRVAVVHRPRYDDWSLPKGKVHARENPLIAAVRELREETGAEVRLSRRLITTHYAVAGVPKSVAFWAAEHRGGEFTANDEVDELRWLPIDQAAVLLSYDTDRAVLADFGSAPVPDAAVVLLRHARAGRRADWHGDDALRPLDHKGRRQADDLASVLTVFGPTSVHTADRTRCEETVRPLAERLDLEVSVDPVWSDESFSDLPGRSLTALLGLAKPGTVPVVCSQGTAIPGLIERIGRNLRTPETRKAGWWVITFVDGDVLATDHYDPPL